MIRFFLFSVISLILISCNPASNSSSKKKKRHVTFSKLSYKSNVKAVVSIETYDHYSRKLKTGYGFYIAKDIVVANLDLIKGCYKAKIAPMNTDDYTDIRGFVAYDFNTALVLLKTQSKNLNYLKLKNGVSEADSIYSLYRKDKKLFFRKSPLSPEINRDTVSFAPVTNRLMLPGKPVFTYDHRPLGILQYRTINKEKQLVELPVKWISQLSKKAKINPEGLYNLSVKTDKVYPSYKTIKGFRIVTDMGNIEIRLFNQTPKYRDNFIKLVSDHFYDSLLIHRVLKKFLIQTGAADTKYAKKDDVVGWQGPGYTLPMNIQPGLFHRRGAIAASKLPDDRNPKNRSDGSQFYIIAGRIFSNSELDDIEKEKGVKFTAKQREVYTTIGGAPYLDGDYTVFSEVVKGMSVVDRIADVETYSVDRPVKDIRVKTIEIIR